MGLRFLPMACAVVLLASSPALVLADSVFAWNGQDTVQFRVDQPGTRLEVKDGELLQVGGKDNAVPPLYRGVSAFTDQPEGADLVEFRGTFRKPSSYLNGGPLFNYQGDGKSWYAVYLGGGACCGLDGSVSVQRYDADGTITVLSPTPAGVFDENAPATSLRVVPLTGGVFQVFVNGVFVLESSPDTTYTGGTGGITTYAGCCNQGIVWSQYEYVFNHAPTLAPIEDAEILEGEKFILVLEPDDADADVLTFSAQNLPRGATFDTTTGTMEWTPDFDQAGEYVVTFSVSDGRRADEVEARVVVKNFPAVADPVCEVGILPSPLC